MIPSIRMRGLLNINKPSGITSYDVIRRIKPIIKPKRIGHTGTLDPIGTGVLLILINEATKISRFLLNQPKEYEAEIQFGVQTDTDDITGKPIATAPVPQINFDEVAKAITDKFIGELEQIPPRFSALKNNGTPLYKLARQGVEVSPQPRRVKIYELELLNWQPPYARIRCLVSSGTYIRSLARDIGLALNSRATLTRLTRTRVGDFSLASAIDLDNLTTTNTDIKNFLIPVEQALTQLPRITVTTEQAQMLLQGKIITLPVSAPTIIPEIQNRSPSIFRELRNNALALCPNRNFLALVKISDNRVKTVKIIYAD
ncbi:MAG: tRNA pseudouridine(55) synthase TruB [candidate division WOR-3 bacterium]|nr:tRNA pseudouridine(55) synthase TruB [candidate division WOR-3 bacterium]